MIPCNQFIANKHIKHPVSTIIAWRKDIDRDWNILSALLSPRFVDRSTVSKSFQGRQMDCGFQKQDTWSFRFLFIQSSSANISKVGPLCVNVPKMHDRELFACEMIHVTTCR
jgi:hypothetical protein